MAIYSKLRDLLFDAGLSEACVAVYLELLKKPAFTIWELVQRTALSKSSVYRAFEGLKELKMVEKKTGEIRALSLKALVAELVKSERKFRKTAYQIKNIAPFLRAPRESIEEFESFYTPEQIAETYVDFSLLNFGVSLDFGNFESYVPIIGGLDRVIKFRTNRLKHASAYAICTNSGPFTSYFCTRDAKVKFKNTVDFLNNATNKNFIVFSDTSDYVMFNNFDDEENPTAVLVKSKTVADAQRLQLRTFSQLLGKN